MTPQTVLAPDIEQVLLAPPKTIPRAEHLEPFVAAARDIMEQELSCQVEAGKLTVAGGSCTTQDVTAIIGIKGQITGLVLYGMSEEMAKAIVGQLMGETVEELDDLAMSGIGELANWISGRATTLLSELGIVADIAPPVLLQGSGSRVSTSGIQRLVVPLKTDLGVIESQLAIKTN